MSEKKRVPPEHKENPEIAVTRSDEAVVKTAKKLRASEGPRTVTLSTGAKATLKKVSPALIQDVQRAIKDPAIPVVFIKEKDREEANPSDPAYVEAMAEAMAQRTTAVTDALVMFGIELEPGFEIDPRWIGRLKRLGIEFDEDDPDEVEFRFKKYGMTAEMMMELAVMSGVTAQGIEEFRDFFRREEARDGD